MWARASTEVHTKKKAFCIIWQQFEGVLRRFFSSILFHVHAYTGKNEGDTHTKKKSCGTEIGERQ